MPITREEMEVIRTAMTTNVQSARAADTTRIAALETELQEAREARTDPVPQRRASIYGNEMTREEMSEGERRLVLISRIGNYARALAYTRGDQTRAAGIVERDYHDERTATLMRSMAESSFTEGGSLVEEQFSDDLIDLLYPNAVMRQLAGGATVIPMPLGNLTLHKVTSGVSGNYEAELANIRVQKPTTDRMSLSAKKLAVIVPMSNELLQDTSGRVNALVVRDIGRGLTLRADLAFIRGNGVDNTPVGILNQVPVSRVFADDTAVNLPDVLGAVRTAMRSADMMQDRMGFIMSPELEGAFYAARKDATFLNRDEMNQGRLNGYPYMTTSQIPANLANAAGTSTTVTELYFGDMSEVMLMETSALQMDYSTDGSYFDGTKLVSAFSTDQTLIRAKTRHDLGLRNDLSWVVQKIDYANIAPF